MLVSIIVPMYNAERFVSDTLASLTSESSIPIEIIVVNDRSTDRSIERVLEFHDERIRLIDGPGRGAPAAMNAGFAEARGSIIMCCDSDDTYPHTRIRRQVELLASHPYCDAVCGSFSTMNERGKLIGELACGDAPADLNDELLQGKTRTSFCTYAVRTSLAAKLGGFREFFESAYDIDYQLRLGETGRVRFFPENFYYYRLHSSSITHSQPNAVRKFFERTAREMQTQRRVSGSDDVQRGRPPARPTMAHAPAGDPREQIQGQLLGAAWHLHRTGNRIAALQTGGRAVAVNPLKLNVWRSLLALALKRSS